MSYYQLIIAGQLRPANIVNIYTAYRTEAPSTFEGAAVLIKKVEDGHSFIVQDEKLVTKAEDRAMINGKHIPLTQSQENNNKKHQRLADFFTTTNKDIKAVKDTLRKLVTRDPTKLKLLYNTIIALRHKHVNSDTRVGTLFKEYDDNYIALFFQQKYLKNWSPTIYRDEKWLVEFLPEQYDIDKQECLYNDCIPFRTYRRIRTIVCISPSDDLESCDYRRYTTDDGGQSNHDRKQQRELRKRLEAELDAYETSLNNDDIKYTDEEIEVLDMLLLKKRKKHKKPCVGIDCDEEEDDESPTQLENDDSSFDNIF